MNLFHTFAAHCIFEFHRTLDKCSFIDTLYFICVQFGDFYVNQSLAGQSITLTHINYKEVQLRPRNSLHHYFSIVIL
jgi:hypothetical protein